MKYRNSQGGFNMLSLTQINNQATVIPFPFFIQPENVHQLKVKPPTTSEFDTKQKQTKGMKLPVEPLSESQYIQLRDYFFNNDGYFKTTPINKRNYLYIVLGVNLAGRAGDMLNLKISDVLNQDGSFKDHVIFTHEEKTGNRRVVKLNERCKVALTEYFNSLTGYQMDDWLFPNFKQPGTHMTVDGVRKMLKRTSEKLGLDLHIGTHSLRKTLPHYVISNSTCIADEVAVSQFLGHRDVKTTYHYIGRTQQEQDLFIEKFGL